VKQKLHATEAENRLESDAFDDSPDRVEAEYRQSRL
jgi:hypothetical protein